MAPSVVSLSVALFLVAALLEIGGGYLVWQWWRNSSSWMVGVAGALMLALYGIVPTYQPRILGVSTPPMAGCSW